jgi:hypothetical protein
LSIFSFSMAVSFYIRESRMSNKSMQTRENWQRLWLPIEEWEVIPRIGEDFLTGEGEAFATEWFSAQKLPGIQPLSAFADIPFLLLLGRPGAGKSKEIEKAAEEHALGRCTLVRGKEIGSSDPGPLIQQQIESEYPHAADRENLRILIDGLDEVTLSREGNEFGPRLLRWLRGQKNADGQPRYRLAISTRWADWPEREVNEIAALWPSGSFKKLVLAPLKYPDVRQSLNRLYGDTDADRFWYLMMTSRLQSVACWPQGLLSLMTGFENKDRKRLAQSYGEAIGDQVRGLCALTDNRDDRGRWEASKTGSEWRGRLAGRLAATMIFSGRQSLCLDTTRTSDDDHSLRIEDLSHSEELWNGERKLILTEDLDALVEHTGLLKRQGSRRRWVFQSHVYQEWLAADWIASQELDSKRLQELLGHIHEGTWRVYTPLKPVAAWLAGMDSNFLTLLRENDPLVLLRMDAGTLPDKERQRVAEAILRATNTIGTADYAEVENSHLGSLMHPGLASQLRAWLDDPTAHPATQEMALEMIQRAEIKELVPYLWTLYPQTKGRLRIEAAKTLTKLAQHEDSIPQWQLVLRGEIPMDGYGGILAAALEYLVIKKRRVPVRDIIHWVLPKRRFEVIGQYEMVIPNLPQVLTVKDVPTVFTHLKKADLHDDYEAFEPATSFNKQALKQAILHFDRPEIADALADYWHHCVSRYYHPHKVLDLAVIAEEGGFDAELRRKEVIHHLIHHPKFEANKKRKYLDSKYYLFVSEDMEWCLEEILLSDSPDDKWQHALVVVDHAWRADLTGATGEKLDQALKKNSFLRELLPKPEAGRTICETIADIRQKQQEEQEAETAKLALRQRQLKEAFQNRIAAHTESCQQDHGQGHIVWPDVLTILGARKHGRGSFIVTFGLEDEVKTEEEWMRDAARRYLIELPNQRSIEDRDSIHALLALAVCHQDLTHAGPVQESVVVHWLPWLIRCMTDSCLEKESAGLSRSHIAGLFPEPFARAFGEVMKHRYLNQSTLAELRGFVPFWNPQMTAEILQILTEEQVQPSGFPTALRHLFQISPEDALSVARHWLAKMDALDDKAKATVLGSCLLLLQGRLAQEVLPWLENEALLAPAFLVALNSLDDSRKHLDVSSWPNEALQGLANTAWKAFPRFKISRATTNTSRMFHAVTAEDSAHEFRGHITAQARNRGLRVNIPPSPSDETQEDAATRESFANWNDHLIQSRKAGEGWQPLAPEALFKLAKTPNARLARNNDELMQAVIESLRRWEDSLSVDGKWDELWDINPPACRNEEDIAKKMRNWLKQDLQQVLVEREVELDSEERTDILIQVTPKDPGLPILTLAIELKRVRPGNKTERRTAMKTQLLEGYLTERAHEGWTHGLYVVTWTSSPGGKDDTSAAMEEESALLETQAKKLSNDPFTLQSLVLDARYRGKTAPSSKSAARKKTAPKKPSSKKKSQ